MYEIIQKYITNNRSGKQLKPQGVVVHETATPGATSEDEYNYFNKTYRGASAHFFVDNEQIIQTVPTFEVAWGSGPTSNAQYWQIEMCQPYKYDMEYFEQVWERTVWLVVKLFKENNIYVTKDTLLSHAEVSDRWRETTHRDPISYFYEYGMDMDKFRNEVLSKILEVGHVKNLIVFSGDGDKSPADILRDNISGYMVSRATYQDNPVVADNVFVVGGTWKPDGTNAVLLSGETRFETAEAVCKYIRGRK
jgi:N-acetylmuramoyl-L-alanine amidase